MQRYYYVSADLDELEMVENELESAGLPTEQIHVLTQNDLDAAHHHIHAVTSFMKNDVVHSSLVGAVIGVIAAVLVLVVAWLTGWPETLTWAPFVFLAIVLLGFCTWEGGLYGIQEPNHHFRNFQKILDHGKHILFVDVDPDQRDILREVCKSHPRLKRLGKGSGAPKWIVRSQQAFQRFVKWAP